MVKLFGLVSLLAGLAVGALVWSQQATQASKDAPPAIVQTAARALELNHRIRGTYAGVAFSDVKVVRADASSYCVEAAGYHVTGPGGKPESGRC